MSLLPQRKKSPEEIAKLRESLGVPGAQGQVQEPQGVAAPSAASPAEVETFISSNHQAARVHPVQEVSPSPQSRDKLSGPKHLHSFKRFERPLTGAVALTPQGLPSPVTLDVRSPKPVRSLRKSEQFPLPPQPESPPDSRLPHQRHSDEEIESIRRREMLSLMNAKPNPRLFPAHPALILPGYLAAMVAVVGLCFYDFPILATLGCVMVSMLVAAFIGIRKPVSRHHAAFIAVIALFLMIFAALHYFPQLRHAT